MNANVLVCNSNNNNDNNTTKTIIIILMKSRLQGFLSCLEFVFGSRAAYFQRRNQALNKGVFKRR